MQAGTFGFVSLYPEIDSLHPVRLELSSLFPIGGNSLKSHQPFPEGLWPVSPGARDVLDP